MEKKVNLLGLNQEAMRCFFQEIGEKPFRATQVMKWIHEAGVTDFSEMTNLGKALQSKLHNLAEVTFPDIIKDNTASDGTRKWVLKLSCGNSVETVFIPEKKRGTLCVSSQAGCVLDCKFCSTGKQGFNRNLTSAEIISQVFIAVRLLSSQNGFHDRHITNVVMMGMGEPLLNFDAVVSAMDIMMDDHAYGLAKRRVTLSTSGIIPEMKRLKERSSVALAVSLHAPNDALRTEIMPINKKYPLNELMAVCRTYFENESRRKVTFEYVMLKDVNDTKAHALELARLLSDVPCKVNLIPFNPFPFSPYVCSSKEAILQFSEVLMKRGINTMVRKTRGDDIDAACGQLVGNVVEDKTRRQVNWQKLNFRPMSEVVSS